ncbi:MAG: GatB/YqeY domain-containing protein [Candidatus Omnitrophica bacterium]|nr:GatB/YqeY domain-containing protein [Candidatus Omnitrophota bacterium]
MSLQEKIDSDLKQAMAAKDAARLSTIRFLKSALKYIAIEKKSDTLSDADVQLLIQKQIKQRRESIDQFEKGGRRELAEKEKAELAVLEAYLPKQLSDAELQTLVTAEIKAAGASSKKDFGRVMKGLMEKVAGRAEAKRVSDALGKVLP